MTNITEKVIIISSLDFSTITGVTLNLNQMEKTNEDTLSEKVVCSFVFFCM